ncbi:hypothetical protein [Enterovibrio coralii]|uniref:hypothetical protein n=1 Tax=Enterovibrio coralii TaxID=294935 RepID=UPI000B0F1229|nr:hypothetical protein [Enterovibrio coralii]
MTQTSFLLSGISSNKAAVGDAKGAVSQDVTEIEGEGFFSKLSQLVAGDAETVDGKKDAALEGGESEEALNEMLTSALKPEETEGAENLALEGEEIDADGEISTGSEIKADKTALSEDAALSLKAANPDAESGTAERQLAAKQDGEAWLQRLNEANSVLKPQAEHTLDAETVVLNTEGKALVGKSLPSDQSGRELLSTESLNASVLTASSSQDALPFTSVEPASVEEVKAVLASEGIDVSTLSTAELETIAKMAVVQDVTEQQLSSFSPEQQAIDAAAVRAIAINNDGSERPDATGAELVAGSAEAGRVLSNAAIAQTATVTADTKEADLLAKAGAETLTKPQQDA